MTATLLSCWNSLVRAAPEARALAEAATGREVSRGELDRLAETWCAALPANVALAGQWVVFAQPTGAAWLQLFLGLLKAGAVPVALDPSEPPAAQRQTAEAIGAAWWWADGGLQAVAPPHRSRHGDGGLVKLTSGSTAAPRALRFTHAQMLADGRQICRTMGIRPADLNYAAIPFGHSYGLGNLVVPLLAQGTAIVCASDVLPQVIAADVRRWRPTVFPAVPALLRALAAADVPAAALRSLRTVISAGSPLPVETAAAFREKFGRNVHNFYGSSETGGITYDRTGGATLTGRSAGTPLEGVRLRFGRGGFFQVESAAVFTHGNRRQAAGRGAHRPADRAELNARGELVLLGRAGRFVKIAGRRLSLAGWEQACRRVPGVRDAFVTLHPARADELAAAFATELSPAELRARLRGHLAPWKMPRKLVVMPDFPLTDRGKPDGRKLRSLLTGQREKAISPDIR